MISAITSLITIIAILAVNKYKTDQNKSDLESERKARESIGKKLDNALLEVQEHKVKLANVPSMEDVRKEFVSKEMFRQMEKHIDGKFDSVENILGKLAENQDKILAKIDSK